MRNKYPITKYILFALAATGIFVAITIVIFQGGLWITKITAPPKRAAAPDEKTADVADLKVASFSVNTKNPDAVFKKDSKIDFLCVVVNDSATAAKTFRSAIKTAQKELAFVKTAALKPGAKVELRAAFSPQNAGLLPVNCRVDADKSTKEKNKNNNVWPINLYVQ